MSYTFTHKARSGVVGSGDYVFRHYGASSPVTNTPLCFTATSANTTVSISVTGTPTLGQNFQYSTDGSTWNTFTPGTTTVTLASVGDKVYFKGNNPNGVSESDSVYYTFNGGLSRVSGNIMSLIDNGACNTLVIPNDYCFSRLFYNNYYITSAPLLPATTLTTKCYKFLFYNCNSLTTAPVLPATTMTDFCYYYMFKNCYNLVAAPVLPATVLADSCYMCMFGDCTSLTTAPSLSANNLEYSCYGYMFSGCTSLITPPALPSTNLATCCYQYMFYKCTSLTTAPTLPATTLANSCYSTMFADCTSLTIPPALPATTLADSCYQGMFIDCTSLTTAPSLPATTLTVSCYSSMFYGCSALTTVPALPAPRLVSIYCYNRMFLDCTSLYVSDSPVAGVAEQAWSMPTSGTFTNTSNFNQEYMFLGCLGTREYNTMPGHAGTAYTYYTQNTPV